MSILKYFKTSGGATPTHPQSDASDIAAGNRLTIPQPHSDECALSLVPVQLPPTAIDTCSAVDSDKLAMSLLVIIKQAAHFWPICVILTVMNCGRY